MSTLAINQEGLAKLRAEHQVGSDKDLADILHIDKGTVSRAMKGSSAPGPKFIAALLHSFPVKFEEVIDVVGEPGDRPARAFV